MMGWTLDLLFGREIEQLITVRDFQALINRLARIGTQTNHRFEEQAGHSAIAIN
jgi:hypothetical protein